MWLPILLQNFWKRRNKKTAGCSFADSQRRAFFPRYLMEESLSDAKAEWRAWYSSKTLTASLKTGTSRPIAILINQTLLYDCMSNLMFPFRCLLSPFSVHNSSTSFVLFRNTIFSMHICVSFTTVLEVYESSRNHPRYINLIESESWNLSFVRN